MDSEQVLRQASPEYTLANNQVVTHSQKRFYASEECLTARMALQQLVDSSQYDTDSSYFEKYELGFVDRHLYYLSTHPTTLTEGYISNLKLMTRVRPNI